MRFYRNVTQFASIRGSELHYSKNNHKWVERGYKKRDIGKKPVIYSLNVCPTIKLLAK